jgi:hypothetical protein
MDERNATELMKEQIQQHKPPLIKWGDGSFEKSFGHSIFFTNGNKLFRVSSKNSRSLYWQIENRQDVLTD